MGPFVRLQERYLYGYKRFSHHSILPISLESAFLSLYAQEELRSNMQKILYHTGSRAEYKSLPQFIGR